MSADTPRALRFYTLVLRLEAVTLNSRPGSTEPHTREGERRERTSASTLQQYNSYTHIVHSSTSHQQHPSHQQNINRGIQPRRILSLRCCNGQSAHQLGKRSGPSDIWSRSRRHKNIVGASSKNTRSCVRKNPKSAHIGHRT